MNIIYGVVFEEYYIIVFIIFLLRFGSRIDVLDIESKLTQAALLSRARVEGST